jgi:hypothetical protein
MHAGRPRQDDLVIRTQQAWRARVGRELTQEEARQIAENVVGFFQVLWEWARQDCETTKSVSGGSPSRRGEVVVNDGIKSTSDQLADPFEAPAES